MSREVNPVVSSRTLKKSASGVLASLRGSTYRRVRLASKLAAAFLSILDESAPIIPNVRISAIQVVNRVFQPARSNVLNGDCNGRYA